MENSRRGFLQKSAAAVAGLAVPATAVAGGKKRTVAPSDKVRVAVIGCKGMGWSNMNAHFKLPEVDCVAICDVDDSVLDQRAADAEKQQGKKPKTYKDYRKLLEDKDIDTVIIGTPDHWHCLQAIHAMDAGKDVYCEKPLANSIVECDLMIAAAKRYNKIVQVGMWQRSAPHFDSAVKYVQSGKLGKIRLVKSWAYMGWMKPVPVYPDSEPPKGVDYAMWLGPAPKRPFNQNRFHFNFRWFWDYAGGLMTDWGVHLVDIALYGMNAVAPKSVIASGGKFAYPDDGSETPDTLQAVYEYDDFSMLWEHATGIDLGPYNRTHGIAFIGNNGTLVVDRNGWEVIPEKENKDGLSVYKTEMLPHQGRSGDGLENHARNFIDAVKSRDGKNLKCSVETGALSAVNCHLGNVAFKTGRKVYWNHATRQFKNDAEANKLLKPEYHNNWTLPKV